MKLNFFLCIIAHLAIQGLQKKLFVLVQVNGIPELRHVLNAKADLVQALPNVRRRFNFYGMIIIL